LRILITRQTGNSITYVMVACNGIV